MQKWRIFSYAPMKQEVLAAAVNAMPTDPHRMILSVWRVDYSAVAAQLKTIPQLEAADFRFGEAASWGVGVNSQVNLAVVENPTMQMVIELYRSNQGKLGGRILMPSGQRYTQLSGTIALMQFSISGTRQERY